MMRLFCVSCCLTLSALAAGRSILLIATMIGTLAAGAACAHLRECLVAGRVDKGDLVVFHRHLIGADVLGDGAHFLRRHVRLADGVQDARLAVVDVAHHSNHGRSWLQALLVLRLDDLALDGRRHFFLRRRRCLSLLDVEAEVSGDGRGDAEVDRLVH